MAYDGKYLAQGQLPNSEGNIYLTPASTTSYVKSISLSNLGGSTEYVGLYCRKGAGTSRRLFQAELQAGYSAVYTLPIVLEAGDAIRAETTTASTVDYNIFGVEES